MSKKERISIIAAMSKNRRAIGKDNKLLWHIPGDLPRFKRLTMGHPVIMGRKTFESIGKALPGRTNIVLSRQNNLAVPNVIVCQTLEEALKKATDEQTGEIFVIGGGSVYAESLPFADRLYLTIVDDEPDADAFFPDYKDFSKIIEREPHLELSPAFEYITLERP